jgi:hypothetical protein
MTRTASLLKSPPVPRVCGLELGPWEPATEDGKGKAPPSVGRMWLGELRF